MLLQSSSDKVAFTFMLLAIFIFGVLYGVIAYTRNFIPVPQLREAREAVNALIAEAEPKWFVSIEGDDELVGTVAEKTTEAKQLITPGSAAQLAPGLVMLVGIAVTSDGLRNFIRVVDRQGEVVHELLPDWFQIWGDSEGDFPEGRRPLGQPGALLHGVEMAPNGDVIMNFEHLSTVRLSACGDVVWKLDNLGHHSVHIDEGGSIWVSAENYYGAGDTGQQNHNAPLRSWTIQRISAEGEILLNVEVLDILRENDLLGLLHMSSIDNIKTAVTGDTLHLNDIEVFPTGIESTVFEPGDVMISLRNINTVLVLDSNLSKIKYRATGQFLRQHDPDFIHGGRILVYDNRNLAPSSGPEQAHSRIVELDPTSGGDSVYFKGDGESAFFSAILGKQQLLDNGNLMITSSAEGRAFEVDPDGELRWFYNNRVPGGANGLLTQASVLPLAMDSVFFKELAAACH